MYVLVQDPFLVRMCVVSDNAQKNLIERMRDEFY